MLIISINRKKSKNTCEWMAIIKFHWCCMWMYRSVLLYLCIVHKFVSTSVFNSWRRWFLIRNHQTHKSCIVIGMKVERIHIKKQKYSICVRNLIYLPQSYLLIHAFSRKNRWSKWIAKKKPTTKYNVYKEWY